MSSAPIPTLEQALARLEEIVVALEREDLELEEALRLYEEGIGHLRRAQGVLKDAELRVQRLVEEGGEPHLENMPPASALGSRE